MHVRTSHGFLILISGLVVEACDRRFMQRCDNCQIYVSKCMPIEEQKLYVTDHCKDLCGRTSSCQTAEYHSVNSTCTLYNCISVLIEKPYTRVIFRKACAEDCSRFYLTLEDQRNDSISICKLSNLGRIGNRACMAKCFDTEDCRALVYPQVGYDCMLCSSTEVTVFDVVNTNIDEARLMRRICITDMPRNFTQRCLNCEIGDQCQEKFDEIQVENGSICNEICYENIDCKLSTYDSENNLCKLYDCSLVKENNDLVVYRKSNSNDCPVYEIATLNGSYGKCKNMIDSFYVPKLEYCVDKCLDTPRCRGASYIEGKNCRLHDCDSYISASSDKTFLQRKCKDQSVSTTPATPLQTFDLGMTYLKTSEDNTFIVTATTNLLTWSQLSSETRKTSPKAISTSLIVNNDLHSNETKSTTSGRDLAVSELNKSTTTYSTREEVIPSYTFGSLNATHIQADKRPTSGSYTDFVSTSRPETADNTKPTMAPSSLAYKDTAALVKSAYTSNRIASHMSIFLSHTTTQIDIIYRSAMTLVPQTASSKSGSSITASVNLTSMTAQTKTLSGFTQKAAGVSTLSAETATSHAANGPIPLQQSPTTTFPEVLYISNQPAVQSLDLNSTALADLLLAKQSSLSDQESFNGPQLYILIASVASGILAMAFAGLPLYFLLCRKKKIKHSNHVLQDS